LGLILFDWVDDSDSWVGLGAVTDVGDECGKESSKTNKCTGRKDDVGCSVLESDVEVVVNLVRNDLAELTCTAKWTVALSWVDTDTHPTTLTLWLTLKDANTREAETIGTCCVVLRVLKLAKVVWLRTSKRDLAYIWRAVDGCTCALSRDTLVIGGARKKIVAYLCVWHVFKATETSRWVTDRNLALVGGRGTLSCDWLTPALSVALSKGSAKTRVGERACDAKGLKHGQTLREHS